MKKTLLAALALFFLLAQLSYAQREMAITIDDLPLIQGSYADFENIVHSLTRHKVHAAGFVIGKYVHADTINQLELFQNNGLILGNHTYSHINLKHMSSSAYIKDVAQADKILIPFMSVPKYFRYPYLEEGYFWQKNAVRNYLNEQHYIVSTVTVDSRDFEFNNELLQLKQQNPTAPLSDLKQRYLDSV
ncbi:MAG: polysaccharide deacetylase family protein [Legionella sp.]